MFQISKKRIFLILTLSSIIFSCHKEQKKEEKALGLGNSIWVNAKYLETLERTKSPLQAKVFADTVMLSFNLKADTANVVWNFHEGSAFLVKQGNNIQFFNAYEEKKSPEMEGNLQNGLFKINQTSFKKVDTTGFIEKKFWIGKYSTSRGNIDLKFDGKVTGVDSLESYYVWCDYVTTQTDIDLVDFFDKNNKSTTYGYKFAGKEIIFYEFIWSEEGLIGKAGKELFRLKRI
jgi:hypothetical protein